MNKKIIFEIVRKFNYLIWLIVLIFFTVFVTYFYNLNKNNQIIYLNKLLNNIYLGKSLKKITNELSPRYINLEYNVNEGDTYESIINNIDVPNLEKKLLLKTITENKHVKILRVNQKIYFTIDRRNNTKIVNFTIEIDKKKIFFLKEMKLKKILFQESLKKI